MPLRLWLVVMGLLFRRRDDELLKVIDFLVAQIEVLERQVRARESRRGRGKRRLRFRVEEKIALALSAMGLSRELLAKYARIARPETLLRWYRELIRRKWTFAQEKTGRPPLPRDTRRLILRLAQENRGWGYARLQGALRALGCAVSKASIARLLREHGLESAPRRHGGLTWREFLRRHWASLRAADFFTVEVLQGFRLVTYDVLFVICLKTRRVSLAGVTQRADSDFMKRAAWDLTDWRRGNGGVLRPGDRLIHDRDGKFMKTGFTRELEMAGVKCVMLPARSPNLNAFAERFVKSVKRECLEHFIFISQRQLERVLREYVAFYNAQRPHQGVDIGNELLLPEVVRDQLKARAEPVRKLSRLGVLLNFYHCRVA